MDIPAGARQRVQISTGAIPSQKLQTLAAAHPFTQQLDVVFPADGDGAAALHAALSALETAYVKADMALGVLVAQSGAFVNSVELKSTLTMLTANADIDEDDSWCLDPRGLLTLHTSKPTFQTLGLPGTKLPFKTHADEYTVPLPLHPSAPNRPKRDAALRAWDSRRGRPWSVLYSANDVPATTQFAAANGHAELVRFVKCEAPAGLNDVRVPVVSLPQRPQPTDGEAMEDWEADLSALIEWVGMAGLGAQRLAANDRADAYVAVYAPPAPTVIGDVNRLRWRGFLHPEFVQRVLDAVVGLLNVTSNERAATPQFVGITAHGFPHAPVGYIPLGKDGVYVPPGKNGVLQSPARVPRTEGEDAWSVIVAREREGAGSETTRWCLAESIGTLDARWG
ncbi:ribonuclease P 40kDa subunit-domain-containing protein [Mycena crocata]|nr:ribonuclease P 40kDa subunit-domain-containing protein [Mycena crocata]